MQRASLLVIFLSGALFGVGLATASMTNPAVVLSFLRWEDFGLLLVLGGAVAVTTVTYQILPRVMRKPLLEASFRVHLARLNRDTLVGAAIFGVGWGLTGVCPGPALAGLGAGDWNMALAVLGMFAGAWLHAKWASRGTSAL